MNPERMHRPPCEVLLATANDLRPLVDIEEAVSMQKYPNAELGITPEDIAAIGWGEGRVAKYRERFLEHPNANVWVAKENDRIVGYAAAVKDNAGHWLSKLYVATDKQRQGVGSALLARAEGWLGDEEPIWLGIASYNRDALAFYTKHGYEPVGPRPDEQTTVHATATVIHETLLLKHPYSVDLEKNWN